MVKYSAFGHFAELFHGCVICKNMEYSRPRNDLKAAEPTPLTSQEFESSRLCTKPGLMQKCQMKSPKEKTIY